MSQPSFSLFETAIGTCAVAWTDRGLVWVQLPEASVDATRRRATLRTPDAREVKPKGQVRRAIARMQAHLAGELDALTDLALDDAHLPAFHRRVYAALRDVGPGHTVGYGELAALAGSPAAARAVGQAVGKNPFPLIVPCHRVLGAGGRPGGFSAHGGVETKRRMLEIEGVRLGRRPPRRGFDCDLPEALARLRAADPALARIIARSEAPTMPLDAAASTFDALARSIVYQQLNGKAAATILGRVRDLFPQKRITPERLRGESDARLRGAGLSRGKMLALRDLADKVIDGTVPDVKQLHAMSDEAIVDRLVKVRGIGRWTVQMLLMFRLGRPDVLPVDDFGVRHGFQLANGKRKMPTPKELARHGDKWRPYRSVASWYMWRAVDLARAEKNGD